MPPLPPHLVTQFTEDVRATEDMICGRVDCRHPKIKKGDPIHFIASYKPGQSGKLVCGPCLLHYKAKLASTALRPTQSARTLSLAAAVRRSTNAARSRASIDPPPVAAMTQQLAYPSMPSLPIPSSRMSQHSTRLSMAPPPVPSVRTSRSRGPEVHIPTAKYSAPPIDTRSHPAYSVSSAPQTGTAGYGPQHLHYQAQHREWAQKAHARQPVPPAETYAVDITAVYESSASRRNTRLNNFGCIREGLKDIDTRSQAEDLVQVALATLVPLIKAYCPEFPWREAEFIVRDKRWLNLATQTVSDSPGHFYNECLVVGKKGALKFKPGKQFPLFVVVPEKQWDELEEFRESLKALTKSSKPSSHAHRSVPRQRSQSPTASAVVPSTFASHSSRNVLTTTTHSSTSAADSSHGISISAFHSSCDILTSTPHSSRETVQVQFAIPSSDARSAASMVPPHYMGPTMPTASKRSLHHRDNSITSVTSRSPPLKKSVPAVGSPPSPFASPNHNHLRQALQSGGNTNFDVKSDISSMLAKNRSG
ncbi:hypothetical protein JVT61DRAFT_14076 [Boletus reticuloceps]|uniref:Uncharacterized protein n=1 Tax=Boletus reticuloceps TaxID=495285 RepID=A0A8I3ADD6_9AGAM|nr:hypothetical protein JVT61DRAFT_14076 [Boletus reticuloceps]